MIKTFTALIAAILLSAIVAGSAVAQEKNQVFFRGGYSLLTHDRGSQVFTDTNGTITLIVVRTH